MLETLDAAAVRRWTQLAAESLAAQRAGINRINVFPVADADTGTNLAVTLAAASEALAGPDAPDETGDVADVLRAAARASVLAAQGNSGIIAAQILTGLADGIGPGPCCDAAALQGGLSVAAAQAYQAVGDPAEGTALTVMRAAAEAAGAVDLSAHQSGGAQLGAVIDAAVRGAVLALDRTPDQLAALAEAGVVDAGGAGVVVLLDCLALVVTGQSSAGDLPVWPRRTAARLEVPREQGSEEFPYEVQYLLEAELSAVEALRRQLTRLGDSVAIVGTGDGLWNVHVHVAEVGAAIEAGIEAGRPSRIAVVRFADQRTRPAGPQTSTVLAVVPTAGFGALLTVEGVTVLDEAGASPSGVLGVLTGSQARRVILLADVELAEAVAARAVDPAGEAGVEVSVVPTRSVLQTLAAVAVHDGARRADDNVIAMAEAAAATRFAEVRVAEHDSLTTVGQCRAGDVLGLIDGEVVRIGRSVGAVALEITDRLLGTGGELITVVLGNQSAPDAGDALRRHIAHVAPLTEVVVYEVADADIQLMIGME